ncbi:SRPBCC family protein [Sphaerisporangium sp. B11E5]|uniref:SRPBCC family protein n=1 Tax=Sphaerisporangium sp. B11E5 TaxID=3153563 RepID=UPI00325F7DD7
MTYPSHIDRHAAVVVRSGIRIAAPIQRVWRLHTDVGGWPQWQPDIDAAHLGGPVRAGTTFRWATAGLSIVSTIYAVDPPRRILWGGPANGITGIHDWTFDADDDATLVRTEESWNGAPVRSDAADLRSALTASLTSWLEHLRRAAER